MLSPVLDDRRDRPAVSVAKALGSATRAGIFEHLRTLDGPASVRDVADAFDVHPNVARTHLDTLVDAGLVEIGRRKNPAGGRPANVYRARRSAVVPASRGGGLPESQALLLTLLGRLIEHPGEHRALNARAFDVALREGRRLTAEQQTEPDLSAATAAAVVILAHYAPTARVVNAAGDWVDVAGLDTLFADADAVRAEVADALARGLLCGAVAGLGVPVNVTDAGALPGGEPVWRVRQADSPAGGPALGDVASTIDTRKLHREAGVVEAMRAITTLRPGQVVEVLTEGPGSPAAFARWADRAGHQLLGVERAVDPAGKPGIRLLIRKGR
jgi:predicted ArsR family transcriptional regulator/TusA-related sulfurtransferase